MTMLVSFRRPQPNFTLPPSHKENPTREHYVSGKCPHPVIYLRLPSNTLMNNSWTFYFNQDNPKIVLQKSNGQINKAYSHAIF